MSKRKADVNNDDIANSRQTAEFIAPTPVSSSESQSPPLGGMTFGKARALATEEVEDVVRRFVWASKQFYAAGADGYALPTMLPANV